MLHDSITKYLHVMDMVPRNVFGIQVGVSVIDKSKLFLSNNCSHIFFNVSINFILIWDLIGHFKGWENSEFGWQLCQAPMNCLFHYKKMLSSLVLGFNSRDLVDKIYSFISLDFQSILAGLSF